MLKESHSPLTDKISDQIGEVKTSEIIRMYSDNHNIDVSKYLPDADAIQLYQCRQSGLKFFASSCNEAPPEFYEELYSNDGKDWGYQDQKWEFAKALELIDGYDSILDVGSGDGSFLKTARDAGHQIRGLETSAFGREQSLEIRIQVEDTSVARFASDFLASFDAVTTFQVLEHIRDPFRFIKACVQLIRVGGIFIVSVPNNDSFLDRAGLLPLNCPPHHLTRWNREALEYITQIFPLQLKWVEYEPLQAEHLGWYRSTLEKRYLPNSWLFKSIYFRFGGVRRMNQFLTENRHTIQGHTILIAFEKI